MCTYKVVKMVSLTFLPFSIFVSFVCVNKEKSDNVIIDSGTKLEIRRRIN